MSQGPSKKDLLRRYLEQNGSEPNPRNDTLDRLAMKREVLKWEKEQKEEAEQTRREFLEYQQSERMKRLNSETSSGRIALAKGSQAGLELPEPQLIREMFAAQESRRQMERDKARMEAQRRRMQENYSQQQQEQIRWIPPPPPPPPPLSSEQMSALQLSYEGALRRAASLVIPSKPKPPDIPMAPDTRKRKIILRD